MNIDTVNPEPENNKFLPAIFSTKPETHHINIWTLSKVNNPPHKENHFFTDIDKAAAFAGSALPPGTDIYFGVGTLAKKPQKGRGELDDIGGIGAIHLDVDVMHADTAVHKKQNLPLTLEAALEFVNGIDLKPSIIVNSGYGLHAYWLLDKFWAFADADKGNAARLLESWQRMFKWRAGHQKWEIDSTFDLTRVLRVPDTLNWKVPEMPAPTCVLHFDDSLRYAPGDLDNFLTSQQIPTTTTASTNGHKPAKKQATADTSDDYSKTNIEIDSQATAPHEQINRLRSQDKGFNAAWDNKRDYAADQTGSSRDMALANIGVAQGLTDQEITNLLIHNRRVHEPNNPKLRLDYYQRTIHEAHKEMDQQRAINLARKRAIDPTDKNTLRDDIKTLLGIEIDRIERVLDDPPYFVLCFANGSQITVGDSKGLLEQKDFRRFVSNAIGRPPEKLATKAWDDVVPKLFGFVEEVQPDEDLSPQGQFREQILSFLKTGLIRDKDEYLESLTNRLIDENGAGIIGEFLYIQVAPLWSHIKLHYNKQTERKTIIVNLKRIGANRITKNIRKDKEKVMSFSLYQLPGELTRLAIEQSSGINDEDVPYAGKMNDLSTGGEAWRM